MTLKSIGYSTKPYLLLCSMIALTACEDFTLGDLNSKLNPRPGSQTSQTTQLAPRPQPDSRGVITYPNYQVIVAQRNDTMADLASRVGMTAQDLARHNGLPENYIARRGEVLALPPGVITPTTEAISQSTLESRAQAAIDRAGDTPIQTGTLQTGPEPIRHTVEQGETAYSIARLYGVSVTSLASWNGLDRNLTVRPGQQLLIPVADDGSIKETVILPAAGTTPEPPSASQPLPKDVKVAELPDSPNLASDRTPAGASGKLLRPVSGKTIRGYKSGGNEGLDIASPAGSSVKAAESGEVALISKSSSQNTIVLIRHPDNLYTVYSNVTGVSVKKGQRVKRGQTIAKVANGSPSFMHFEIRRGTESVDPIPYL